MASIRERNGKFNVIYQTRCQEPYGASGTFFVNLIKKSLTIRLWQDR